MTKTPTPSLSAFINHPPLLQATSEPLLASESSSEPARKSSVKKKSAEELIQTSFRLPRSRWKKLQELAIDERRSVQSILVEAIDGVFSKKGLKF